MADLRRKLIVGTAILAVGVAAIIAYVSTHPSPPNPTQRQQPIAASPPIRADRASGAQPARRPGEPIVLATSQRARTFAAPFDARMMPEPMPMPRGRWEDQADALAREFTAAGASSVAALYAATLASGYVVRKPDGSLLQPAHSQGLGFEWWEVAALAKLQGRGYGVTLAHLDETLRRGLPPLKDASVAGNLRDALIAALRSNHEGLQFWAAFIIDLGHYADQPYDLLRPDDEAKARLNPVQVAFLLTRLAGEVGAASPTNPRPRASTVPNRRGPGVETYFFATVLAQDNPCGFDATHGAIADVAALLSTSVMGPLVGRLSALVGGTVGAANLIGTLVKFILSYAFLDISITMDADELIRTKDTDPGDYRRLTATLKTDVDKAPYLDCLRQAMNAVGVDLTMPDAGPVPDARLDWSMVAGGTVVRGSGSNRWVEHGIVYFEGAEGQDRSPAKQFTDDQGQNGIDVVGAPQERDLSREKTTEVEKEAGVQVNVQLHGRVQGGAGLASELSSVFGSAISFLTGDVLSGVVGTATEMAYRSAWYASEPFYFPVKDWQPCGGVWSGMINYSADFHETASGVKANNVSIRGEATTYTANIVVAAAGSRDTDAMVHATASQTRYSFGKGLDACYRVTTQIQQLNGTVDDKASVSVSADNVAKRYSVGYTIPVVPSKGTNVVTSAVAGECRNPFNKPVNQRTQEELQLSEGLVVPIEGEIDPAHPDVIRGANFVDQPTSNGSRQASAFWSLARCQ